MSRFLSSIVLLCTAIFLLPAENRSQNLIPEERHHVILCFDANGNQGKIDLTSKAGQEKLREALDSLFIRLQQPESGAETRPIFAPSQHDLATIVYYVPDARGAGKISDFDFTRDFVFLPPTGSMVAEENLPIVDNFIPIYTEILKNNRRGDALTLYQEAAAAGILKLAKPQFVEALKPVDKIYLINFYAENINLSSAYNTLDAFIRKTWPDTTDSPGATAKRDNLFGQLSSIKSRLTEINRNTVQHIYGFRLHYTVAKYNPTPADAANFLQDPLQDFSFHTADGDNIDAELDLKRCLLDSRLEQLQPEFWTLLIFGGQAGGDTLAQNFGYVSESYVARARASFSRLNALPKDSLRARTQIIAYATEPLALKARLKSNTLDLKIALPSWSSRNSGWIVPLIIIAFFVAGFYVAKIVMARKERRRRVDLALEKVPMASRLRIDLDSANPQFNTIATLKLSNASLYNRYQNETRFRYGVASGKITIQAEALYGTQPIHFKLSAVKPLVGLQFSKDGQTVIVDTHESISIPVREEDQPSRTQRTGVETRNINIQPSLIEDVLDCPNLDEEVDVDLKITATCEGADGAPPAACDPIFVPLRMVRQHARLDVSVANEEKEISYNDSAPQRFCDFVFTVPPESAKIFSMPITASFKIENPDFPAEKFPLEEFPFQLYDGNDLVDKVALHKLLPGQKKNFSAFVNWSKIDWSKTVFKVPLKEGEKKELKIQLFLLPEPTMAGLPGGQQKSLQEIGVTHTFYVTPDRRKPHISVEIASDYFDLDNRDAVLKDDVYDVIFEKSTTLHPIKFEFDPTSMDLQAGLTRDPIAKLTIHSHRSTRNIGEIKKIFIDFEQKVHSSFLQFETADKRENLQKKHQDGDEASRELRGELIPTGENQKIELRFYIDWGAFRDALRAGKLSYITKPAENGKYSQASVVEFDGKPYDFNVGFTVEIEKPGKNPLKWKLNWRIKLSPCKNQFWISIDYGTSAIAAACWNVGSPFDSLTELPLQEKWFAKNKKITKDTIPDKFLSSRMRLLATSSKPDVRLGQPNFVEFVNPWQPDSRWQNMLAPLKTMITEPVINLPRSIDFFDEDGNLVKLGLPKTDLVLRSMYYHLFQEYIIPCIKDHLQKVVWEPRLKRSRDQRDRCFVSMKEYLTRFVITVPNSFTYWHTHYKLRKQLEAIARDHNNTMMPGDRTEFVFLSESEAVAYYYLMKRRTGEIENPLSSKPIGEEEYILIYDQGAGTLDISYVRLSNIFSTSDPKPRIEILSQVGVYAAGNNINYALAEIVEDGINNKEIKAIAIEEPESKETQNEGKEITFIPMRSLLPVPDNQSPDKRRFMESKESFNEELLLFVIDLERKKRDFSRTNSIGFRMLSYSEIFHKDVQVFNEFKLEAGYVYNKFYNNTAGDRKKSTSNLAQRMTNDILESLFKLSILPSEQRTMGKIPLDRVIFSGRSTAFMNLQGKVCETLQHWTAKEIESFAFDGNEAKAAVSQGALYYAAKVLATDQTVKEKRLPIFVRYVVRDSVNGTPIFKELLSPHSKFDDKFCTNKLRISLFHSKDIILYETRKEIDELNKMKEEELRRAIIEICRVPGTVAKSLSVEVELIVNVDTGQLVFRVDGSEPSAEFLCPPPKNDPGYEEGQWPYIFMSESDASSTTSETEEYKEEH